MPEQLLNDAQVRAALEQVGGERMTQRMWTDAAFEARSRGRMPDRRPGLLPGQPPSAVAEEQIASRRSATRWASSLHSFGTFSSAPIRDTSSTPASPGRQYSNA